MIPYVHLAYRPFVSAAFRAWSLASPPPLLTAATPPGSAVSWLRKLGAVTMRSRLITITTARRRSVACCL